MFSTPRSSSYKQPYSGNKHNLALIGSKCIGLNLFQPLLPPPQPTSPLTANTGAPPTSPKLNAIKNWFETKVMKQRKETPEMTTTFLFEFRLAGGNSTCVWNASRTAEELFDLYTQLYKDIAMFGQKTRKFLDELEVFVKTSFELREDSDTMEYVEIKETGESFLMGVVTHVDFLSYSPLAVFIDSHKCIELVTPYVKRIQKMYRYYKLRSNKLSMLFKFYNTDLEQLIILLEGGIECYSFVNYTQFRQLSSTLKNIQPFTNKENGNGNDYADDNTADFFGLPVGMVPAVMWLETDERFPGRSRVCVAPREVFEFQLGGENGDWEREVERCANSVALVDIAEVRLGAATHNFRTKGLEYNCKYNQAYSFSIIGAERTIDVQLPHAFLQSVRSENEEVGSSINLPNRSSTNSNTSRGSHNVPSITEASVYFTRGLSTSSNNSDCRGKGGFQMSPHSALSTDNKSGGKSPTLSFTGFLTNSFRMSTGSINSENNIELNLGLNTMNRDWLVDMLSLLALQMLEPGEAKLRRRQYRRAHMLRQFSKGDNFPYDKPAKVSDLKEAKKMESILIKSLKVDEEILNSNISRTSSKTLWYSEVERRLYIGNVGEDGIGFATTTIDSNSTEIVNSSIICIDVDDISEIRPGKFSFNIDGHDFKPRITIVGTETSICLPMPTRKLRDKLLRRFQAFLCINSRIGCRDGKIKGRDKKTLLCEEPLFPRNVNWKPNNSIEEYFGK